MPHFCKCGADEYICQVCGQVKCSKEQPAEWRPDITGHEGAGNVCPACLGNNGNGYKKVVRADTWAKAGKLLGQEARCVGTNEDVTKETDKAIQLTTYDPIYRCKRQGWWPKSQLTAIVGPNGLTAYCPPEWLAKAKGYN